MTRLGVSAFRDRLVIETRIETPDGAGGVKRDWTPSATIWAAVETLDAEQRFEAGQIGQRLTHRVTLRYRDDLDTTQRFRRAGDVLAIRGVRDPDGHKRRLVCACEELRP